MSIVGHMLTHTWEELKRIGISDELVRKYIVEQYPRDSNVEIRQEETLTGVVGLQKQPGTIYPLSVLLILNLKLNDGLSGLLFQTISEVCLRVQAKFGKRQRQIC